MTPEAVAVGLEAWLRGAAIPMTPDAADRFDPLIEAIGDARFVLIGEATHGTDEFYGERAELAERLITQKGFRAVAAEVDWPDAYRLNSYVRGQSTARTAEQALGGFRRFPTWMWRNTAVVSFLEWLKQHNEGLSPDAHAGF